MKIRSRTIPGSHALIHSLLIDLGCSVTVPGDRTSYRRPWPY